MRDEGAQDGLRKKKAKKKKRRGRKSLLTITGSHHERKGGGAKNTGLYKSQKEKEPLDTWCKKKKTKGGERVIGGLHLRKSLMRVTFPELQRGAHQSGKRKERADGNYDRIRKTGQGKKSSRKRRATEGSVGGEEEAGEEAVLKFYKEGTEKGRAILFSRIR